MAPGKDRASLEDRHAAYRTVIRAAFQLCIVQLHHFGDCGTFKAPVANVCVTFFLVRVVFVFQIIFSVVELPKIFVTTSHHAPEQRSR